MIRYYFAYGSNLNIEQMNYRCPGARLIGATLLKDYRLVFKGSKTGSYLTIEKHKGSSVPIGVWETSEENETRLDSYEGYPGFYDKVEMKIGRRQGYIYIMKDGRPYGYPSPYYVSVCLEGYRDFGFDKDILQKALDDTREEIRNGKQ